MEYPTLNVKQKYRQVTDAFLGYNHNLRIDDNEFYDMMNMTSDYYPVLSPRKYRGQVARSSVKGIIAKDKLCYVTFPSSNPTGNFCMYSDDVADVVTMFMSVGPKELISMGSYVIIMPDRLYINTVPTEEDGKSVYEWGYIDEVHETTTEVTFTLCTLTGDAYYEKGKEPPQTDTAPVNPDNGDMWIDTSSVPHTLKKYSESSSMWVSIPTTYIKIHSTGIGVGLNKYDGVTLSGITADGVTGLNGSHVLWGCEADEIIIIGILDKVTTQAVADGKVTVSRKMPDMDYIIECNNRLWGCKYGENENGEVVNEIYASKLGDFKNWSCQMGISTDSWQASCGSDGPFTGAIAHLGFPLFFKENCVHKVYGDIPTNFRLQNTTCRGVQKGSHKSLAIVNETLFYKSSNAVCAYDGSLPVEMSSALGDIHYKDAVACAHGNKYYINMKSDDGYSLFVYDTARGMWHKEDNLHATDIVSYMNDIYAVENSSGRIVTLLGSRDAYETELDHKLPWMVETGLIGMSLPDMKYISKLLIRMSLDVGSTVDVSIQYDSIGKWEQVCHMEMSSLRSFAIPILPRRCDHFRIRIDGKGQGKIYSITKTIEQGSDVS